MIQISILGLVQFRDSQQRAVDHDHKGKPGVEVCSKYWHIVHRRSHLLSKDCGLHS